MVRKTVSTFLSYNFENSSAECMKDSLILNTVNLLGNKKVYSDSMLEKHRVVVKVSIIFQLPM